VDKDQVLEALLLVSKDKAIAQRKRAACYEAYAELESLRAMRKRVEALADKIDVLSGSMMYTDDACAAYGYVHGQLREALGESHDSNGRRTMAENYQAMLAAALTPPDGEPVAWVRLLSDGGFEGPIMDKQFDVVFRESGAWTPLYSAPQPAPADVVRDADFEKAIRKIRPRANQEGTLRQHGPGYVTGLRTAANMIAAIQNRAAVKESQK
jgi:hypothetical protein